MNKKKNFKVAIIGLGYVGLPLYCLCKQKNIDVHGFDLSKKIINDLKKDNSHISDISNDELKKYKFKKLFNMSEIKNISDRNIIIFCLPTPILKNENPDMTYIKNALNLIKNHISNNVVLILESTVYPGGTREIFTEFIKKRSKNDSQINFGFSSERISPGQKDKKKFKINYQNIPKVVSGNNEKTLKKINFFYKNLFKKTYHFVMILSFISNFLKMILNVLMIPINPKTSIFKSLHFMFKIFGILSITIFSYQIKRY